MIKKNKKGFTLVELIVVIAIIGILVAIAVPVSVNVITNANNNVDLANAKVYESAIKTAYASNQAGGLPTTEAQVKTYIDSGGVKQADFTCKNTNNEFRYNTTTYQFSVYPKTPAAASPWIVIDNT